MVHAKIQTKGFEAYTICWLIFKENNISLTILETVLKGGWRWRGGGTGRLGGGKGFWGQDFCLTCHVLTDLSVLFHLTGSTEGSLGCQHLLAFCQLCEIKEKLDQKPFSQMHLIVYVFKHVYHLKWYSFVGIHVLPSSSPSSLPLPPPTFFPQIISALIPYQQSQH